MNRVVAAEAVTLAGVQVRGREQRPDAIGRRVGIRRIAIPRPEHGQVGRPILRPDGGGAAQREQRQRARSANSAETTNERGSQAAEWNYRRGRRTFQTFSATIVWPAGFG